MTDVLDRIDDAATEAVSDVGPGEIVGWVCVVVGGFTAVVATGAVVALACWGDLMTVGDLL